MSQSTLDETGSHKDQGMSTPPSPDVDLTKYRNEQQQRRKSKRPAKQTAKMASSCSTSKKRKTPAKKSKPLQEIPPETASDTSGNYFVVSLP